jgi:hypothetical protein
MELTYTSTPRTDLPQRRDQFGKKNPLPPKSSLSRQKKKNRERTNRKKKKYLKKIKSERELARAKGARKKLLRNSRGLERNRP